MLRRFLIAASAIAAVAASQPAFAADLQASQPSVEQLMLDLTNADRAANGLPALQFDPDTLSIARARAASQLSTPSLSHYDTTGQLAFVQMLTQSQVSYSLAGENLARSSSADTTMTRRIEDALMQSPTHRKNILEQSFNKVAIGAVVGPDGKIAMAEIFRSAS